MEDATSTADAYLRLRKTPAGGKLQAIRFHSGQTSQLLPTRTTEMLSCRLCVYRICTLSVRRPSPPTLDMANTLSLILERARGCAELPVATILAVIFGLRD